jgi:4-amino-4-deoxy-L-arabinose transferase-like glycosyltransferase
MNTILAILSLTLGIVVALALPGGAAAVLLCAALAVAAGWPLSWVKEHSGFLLQLFVAGLLIRLLIGSMIYGFELQGFFGGDAITYDGVGQALLDSWKGDKFQREMTANWITSSGMGYGMGYLVAAIYTLVGRNMLAVQAVNAVVGAATAPVIFLCARHIFQNSRVARVSALFVAFYPSLVLWSSQGLKDGPIVFLLAVSMLMTLKLGERLKVSYVLTLVLALLGLLSLRFYVFYMMAVAIAGAFLIGMRKWTGRSMARQFAIIIVAGLALTYLGVLRTATTQYEAYGNLQAVQTSRADLATSAQSGFGKDVDVSTTAGALSAVPVGLVYLLFAPFPWQLASLRQSITLPEMVVWWASFPLLVLGVWFTLRHRLRQALPILIFTAMLTLAYSIFQGNVGTAYRQRSQLLVFYFIFVAVGITLLRERREDSRRRAEAIKLSKQQAAALNVARRRQLNEWETIADRISEKIGF